LPIGSCNTLLYGGPKLWIIIALDDNAKLLKKLGETLGSKWKGDIKCILRSKTFFIHPGLLTSWGIRFVTVNKTLFE
jgi:hypothetical protein